MKGLKIYSIENRSAESIGTMKKNNVFMGTIAAVGASLAFTFMDVFVKLLPDIDSGELTFFRGLVGLAFIPLFARKKGERFFTGGHVGLLSIRGFCGSCGLYFFFLSIQGLTLGDAQILAQLAAFFLCILSPLFLAERFPKGAVPALVLIAAGTMGVVQIWNFHSFNIYALFGLASAFFSACAYTAISRLAEKGMTNGLEIVFYFQVFSIVTGLFLMNSFVMPAGVEWLWLIGMGFFALAAQMLMTWAFQHMNSVLVSFVMYLEIPLHVAMGWLLWGEVLPISSVIGGLFIVAGTMVLTIKKKELK